MSKRNYTQVKELLPAILAMVEQGMPNIHVLQKNIQFFIENGVTGLFEQGNCEDLSGEFGELRYYILSKLMWEPYGDVDRWMREFMATYYGMGAQPIRGYIDMLTKYVTEEKVHFHIYDEPSEAKFPQWLLEMADKKFDEAEALQMMKRFWSVFAEAVYRFDIANSLIWTSRILPMLWRARDLSMKSSILGLPVSEKEVLYRETWINCVPAQGINLRQHHIS